MTRLAAARRVYAFEPMPQRARLPLVGASQADGITVLTPYLPGGVSPAAEPRVLAPLVESVLEGDGASMPILWICDAHSFPVVAGVPIAATVHDAGSAGLDPEPSGDDPGCCGLADLVLARDTTQLRRLAPRHPRVHLVPDGVDGQTWDAAVDAASRLVDDVVGAKHAGDRPEATARAGRRRVYSPPLAPPPDPGATDPGRRRW